MSSTVSDPGSSPPLTPMPNPAADIDITSQPAIVVWQTPDGQKHSLKDVGFDLHWNVRSNRAFFKLRGSVSLKAFGRRNIKTNIFLFVHPERIQTLALDETPDAPTSETLGPDSMRLCFELNRTPALVAPKVSLAPRNKSSGAMLDALRAIARQTSFAIYGNISGRALPRPRLRSLCEAASRHNLQSIAAHANITNLYTGNGGTFIGGEHIDAPPVLDASVNSINQGNTAARETSAGSPPSYDELCPSQPCPNVSGSYDVSKKRRRTSSGRDDDLNRKYIEEICGQLLDRRLAELKRETTDQLQELESRIVDHVDVAINKLREDLTEDTGIMIDDQSDDLKSYLKDYVQEEMDEAENRIIDYLSNASVSLQFNP